MTKPQNILFQDNQIHSTYSDGKRTLQEILEYNRTHDQLDLTISDHVDKKTNWFPRYAKELSRLRKKYPQFRVRIGCEVKILDDGTLNTRPEVLRQAEVVLGSVHHFDGIKSMSKEELIEREYELTTLLAQNKDIDILAHPFSMAVRFFRVDVPLVYVEEVYALCKKNGINFEYNHKNAPESVRAFVRAKVANGELTHFSFGSDMHSDLAELGCSSFAARPAVCVLVTGVGGGIGQSILKGLHLSPVRKRIIAADANHLAAGLYVTDAAYLLPNVRSKRYIPELIRVCKKEKVELVFVGTDAELPTLSKNAAKVRKACGARVIVSNTNAIDIADDKWKTAEFLKKSGFPYPASCLPKDVPVFLKKHSFPLVVKPRTGARSIGVHRVRNVRELQRALAVVHTPVIQEYLATEHDEFTCGTLVIAGTNCGVMAGKRWLRDGDTYKALFKRDVGLEKSIAKVAKKLRVEGPCNVQLRKTKRGPVIFEINCRFSGTTGAMSYLGFNGPNMLLQTHLLKRPPRTLAFNESYMLRYWNEVFVSERSVERTKRYTALDSLKSAQNKL